MKLVYIAGPYTADNDILTLRNIHAAEEHGKQVALRGFVPLIPHKNTALWDFDKRFAHWDHTTWIEQICFPLLRCCNAVLVTGDFANSKGTMMEIQHAAQAGIHIAYSLQELECIKE